MWPCAGYGMQTACGFSAEAKEPILSFSLSHFHSALNFNPFFSGRFSGFLMSVIIWVSDQFNPNWGFGFLCFDFVAVTNWVGFLV